MYAFWSYWQLYHKVTFDGVNKLIIVNEGVTSLDIKTNVYSDWKEWIAFEDNAKYLPALRTIGGDPTITGQFAGDIYFTINGWRLVYDPSLTQVTGVLYSDDYDTAYIGYNGAPIYPTLVSSLVTAAAPDLTQVLPYIPTSLETAQAVWNALISQFITNGTFGKKVQTIPEDTWREPTAGNTDPGTFGEAATTGGIAPSAIAAAVWDANRATYNNIGTFGEANQTPVVSPPSVNDIVAGVWNEDATLHLGVDSTGLLLNQVKADTASISLGTTQALSLLDVLIKYEANKTKIDKVAKTLTVYDNDGVSILKVFDLKNSLGQPSVDEIMERIPRP